MMKRIWRLLLVLGAIGALVVVTMSAAVMIERQADAELPRPTGPHAVGRVIYDWRDSSHEVLAWIWYPAEAGSGVPADYVPAQTRALYLPPAAPMRWVARDLSKIHAHSLADARMADIRRPVVMLRGGGALAVVNYTTLAEDLASHGYVVVGIDVPALTGQVVFPDGRVVHRTDENDLELYPAEQTPQIARRLLTIYTSHMSFTLDRLAELNASDPSGRFTGRLDMTHVGAFGHSFGGAQSAQFCHDDARCAAAIDIDGLLFGSVVQEGMAKPFMFLMESLGKKNAEPSAEVRELLAEMRSLYTHLPAETRQSLAIRGANHFTFGDDGIVMWSRILLRLLRVLNVLKIDGTRQVAVTTYAVRTFFDANLTDKPKARLNLLSPQYHELEVLDIQ
jgi:predicted dienelactone hydrolase